ncbi:MAG: acyl-CoA reductase, partial [Candidatus Baltobacteraceae bacterium]
MEARAEQLIAAVADAAARWCNADFPPRVRTAHALAARTGYSAPVVDYALDRLFGAVTREALRATIAGELGALEALDGFVARQGRPDVWFRPAGKVAIVSSDTTIGVALHPLVFAVCAKAEVLVKDREDRLIAAFAETLAQERPELAERVTSQPWDGAEGAARLAEAGVVVAFGRDA